MGCIAAPETNEKLAFYQMLSGTIQILLTLLIVQGVTLRRTAPFNIDLNRSKELNDTFSHTAGTLH